MTREVEAAVLPSQHSVLHCSGLTRDGRACPMPATLKSGRKWCSNHDPSRQDEMRRARSIAARASHQVRVPLELEAWADSFDWTSPEGVHATLRETAALVAKGGLTANQGQAIARLADLRLAGFAKKAAPPRPTIEVRTFPEVKADG